MNLSGLLDILRQQPAYRDLIATGLDNRAGAVLGTIAAARAALTAALAEDTGRPVLLVTARADRAANLAEQLLAWAPALRVLSFPEPNALFYERAPWGPRTIRARLQVLADLACPAPAAQQAGRVIVTTARGLMQRTLPLEFMRNHCLTMDAGGRVPGGQPDDLLARLMHMGYDPASIVTEAGTFSRRGGIIDVFPVADAFPTRIELWGDQIETLRVFDPATQRSLASQPALVLTPAREAMPVYGLVAAARLKGWIHSLPEAEGAPGLDLRADWARLLQKQQFDTLEFYLPWMVDQHTSLLDYLPEDALVLVDEWEDLTDTVAELESQALSLRQAKEEAGAIPPGMPLPYITWGQLGDELAHAGACDLGGLSQMAEQGSPAVGEMFSPGPRFAGELRHFLEHLKDLTRAGRDRVIVVSRQAERLAELWQEHTGGARPIRAENVEEPPDGGPPLFVNGALAEGWRLQETGLATHLLTDAEVFGWRRPEPRRRRQPRPIAPEDFFADLAPGDYVVHVEHGIGHFEGLEKRVLSGVEREYLVVSYSGDNVLYVPIHQADRLGRYVGADDALPDLSRLGTPEWSRVKERTRQAVEEIARDLLALYAKRETVAGHAFSPDTPWQHELEASFPYVETEDQLRALVEVKRDMEKPRPMDRLICGDVGYGKTEVALRAAFKAVMDGKQVAILVPTTVLAQQHFNTFSRRLTAFPITVQMLSRFRTRAEQDDVIAGLAEGTVDIVIGTHRLLSSDVRLQDLGLLVVDEEQRFGVTHKEQIKQLRTEVDVLTLTATPIPRTLWMSLTGVRDISIIDTAPEERLPVRTFVGRRDDDLIREAILREMDRGGQVFFVHNRVQTIYAETEQLKRIVPEARCAVGHGQMNEHELEAVMVQFAEGAIDVLISTSIIEAGLDFPNANTIIVDRADWFGLAQLYQLRGRVGRSANRAFAYFFHPSLGRLTPEARARLETIGEYTDLGVGMSIAMRDLEIRGAGDILGLRQSGHISAVGFHLYTRMLADAVKRLRASHEEPAPDTGEELLRAAVTIDLPLPTYIPTDYVADMALRIQLYRRMADLRAETDIREFGVELADRFGPLPPPVENLLFQLHVKRLAISADVEAVMVEGGQISIRVGGLAHVDRGGLQRRLGNGVRVSRTAIWLPHDAEGWQAALLDVLARLAQERAPRERVH
jgi:transcription-repair coupling factor (superfamily II helicase)